MEIIIFVIEILVKTQQIFNRDHEHARLEMNDLSQGGDSHN